MGAVDADPNFGRKVRGLKVTSAELTDYVERVLRHFEADRGADESFAAWVQRAPEEALVVTDAPCRQPVSGRFRSTAPTAATRTCARTTRTPGRGAAVPARGRSP